MDVRDAHSNLDTYGPRQSFDFIFAVINMGRNSQVLRLAEFDEIDFDPMAIPQSLPKSIAGYAPGQDK